MQAGAWLQGGGWVFSHSVPFLPLGCHVLCAPEDMPREEGRGDRKRVSPEQFFGHKTFPLINVERKRLFVVWVHVTSEQS